MHDVMAWRWILAAATVPLLVSIAVAWPLWRRSLHDPMGSVAGAFVVLVCAVAFVAREYVHVERVTQQCAALERACHFVPEPYVRFFAYAGIAMAQACVLFLIGGRIESRRRETEMSPTWRR